MSRDLYMYRRTYNPHFSPLKTVWMHQHTMRATVKRVHCCVIIRLQYYDCLVVPVSSVVATFPWEKVGLLVEYHPLGEGALFLNGRPPPGLRPTQWLVLNTLREVSQTSLAKSGSFDPVRHI